jgi:hypothetical protein
MIIRSRSLRVLAMLIVVSALAGCSTTNPIVSDWRNPSYGPVTFKRVLVGGLSGEPSIRRNFEDEFVSQLRSAGIVAVPSYRYLSEEDKIDESKLKQAAEKAGADAAIFARSIAVEQKTQYGASYYPTPWFGFYGSHIGAAWSVPYGAPSVYRYNEYTSETTLYDVGKNEIVWTATVKTQEPEDVKAAIKNYVQAVIKSLQEKNLLSRGNSDAIP